MICLDRYLPADRRKYSLADNFDDVFKKFGNNLYDPTQGLETIYAWEGSTAQKPTRDSKWSLYRATRPSGPRARKQMVMGQPFKDLFDITTDRRFLELVEVDEDGYWWQKKFDTPLVNLILFRAAEFHLMRAEILARNDDLVNALVELKPCKTTGGA